MIIVKTLLVGLVGASLCNANISGIVTDTSGTIPISGATIQLEQSGQTATSDTDGRFTLTVTTGVTDRNDQSLPHTIWAWMRCGEFLVKIMERSAIEITAYTVNGKAVSRIQQTMDAGTHSIALPHIGAGVYLYKVKTGNNEFVLMGNSIGGVSRGTDGAVQGPFSKNALARQANVAANIDVIAVTKSGYLNYRMMATNFDTSGIAIKMIVCEDTVIDVDENVYQAVKIGHQVWTVENLRTTRYNDGTPIPFVPDSAGWFKLTTPGYCYCNNTSNVDSIKKFGALYNVFALTSNKLAPAGWHIATDAEWDTLRGFLNVHGYNWDGTTDGDKLAKSLAARTDWVSSTVVGSVGNDLNQNNKSGFSAFPSGCRFGDGPYNDIGYKSYWWCAYKPTEGIVWFRYLLNNYWGTSAKIWTVPTSTYNGYSIRLIRD